MVVLNGYSVDLTSNHIFLQVAYLIQLL